MTLWQRASVGQTLDPGEQVRTGVSAKATIVFDDDSRIELGANATFAVEKAKADGIIIRLPLGFLRAIITKVASRQFQVKTPTAVCSVRGTEFTVDVNQQGHTIVQMFSGVLAIADGLGNETLVRDRERVNVTDKGIGPVQAARNPNGPTPRMLRRDHFKELARRELGFDLAKESLQTAAALQAKKAVYEQGKTAIDINGNRVRIEEYIIRPSADEFKLVVLNERQSSLNLFWYHGVFNTALPTDLSVALKQLPGCVGSACQYFLTSFDSGRSNMIDNEYEIGTGGHQVDVNNDGYSGDAVTSAFNPLTHQVIALNVPVPGATSGNDSYFQTLYNNYNLSFDGDTHVSWSPQGVGNITNYSTAQVAYNYVTALQSPPSCAPPDCTYQEASTMHFVTYEANNNGVNPTIWDKFDNYVISDAGQVATPAAFSNQIKGSSFDQALLNYNFEQVVTASEFQGRSIDIVVAPKMFIQAGIIQ